MLEGSFYCFVPKSPSFLGTLLRSPKAEQQVQDRLDVVYKSAATSPKQQVQKYVFPGGGITVHPGVQVITDCIVRVTPYVHNSKSHVVVFFGNLSNLSDLLQRKHDFQLPLERTGDADASSLTTGILLDLYKQHGDGEEVLLLSELQGQYAFVIYDSNKKQAFAARDASGAVPLFYRIDSDGAVSFTNSLESLPSADASPVWDEIPPGHYISGKQPRLAQFALTPKQLQLRERQESLDADALHAMLRDEADQEEKGQSFSPKSIFRRSRDY